VNKIAIAVVLFASVALAQSKFQPLNVKPGLWESTTTSTTAGQMPVPAELLSKLTPEQRAKFEARMKSNSASRTNTFTHKSCETKEKLAEQPFDDKQECKQTLLTSTSTAAEIRMSCQFGDVTSTGTMKIHVLSPESVKGSGQMTSNGGGHTMNVNTSFSAKWLGASCGSVK